MTLLVVGTDAEKLLMLAMLGGVLMFAVCLIALWRLWFVR